VSPGTPLSGVRAASGWPAPRLKDVQLNAKRFAEAYWNSLR
jgi:serine/threonine-protein kinase RIO1